MAKRKTGGLGRGMETLFTPFNETVEEGERVVEIALDEIRANPYQPRKHFNQEALQELADSIEQSGVFQPVILRKSSIKGYELIAGERRVRASRLAGKTTIPAIVRQMDEEAMIEIAVIENLQREDLSPLEEAEAYQVLMNKLDLTQEQVAKRMGKSRPYIANYLRLLALPEPVKLLIHEGELSMAQGRTLLGLKDKTQIEPLAQEVIKEKMTVRQLEEKVVQLNEIRPAPQPKPAPKTSSKERYIVELEQNLQEKFGTDVLINQRQNSQRGKIEIEFMTADDLTRILDLLNIRL
ncbi:ParB/RepB/Spo0J family partition protein [Dolosicoccus paucivorans]|uniref:Helix-turn-helix domain-containing protein n=1 Tax=Dolosicoccus paucivorans TaxID=84521 RepID=A0A1G8ND99_9LACT|nr:ParB/RepB/Spo0J family partition protein [Dolosicoccus paucivorans]PMB84754.1 helix-turn-helix domain-containing protein [Dolosicoccus paucivorans]PMC58776.1 helix-turn-helix domain-containing protein [Dolosicoccus paucivorans]SDI78132.1 chromosome partitioning protein, ParB family [Dolosicoccus paucivorans]